MKKFVKQFCKEAKESTLTLNKSLRNLNTFKIDCTASVYIEIGSFRDLMIMTRLAKLYNIECFCLGGGSKVLLPNKLKCVVYTLRGKFESIERLDNLLIVGGGTKMQTLCDYTARNNLSCVEWGLGIPCRVGGGVYMNAGCFGKSFSDIVVKVIYTDGEKIMSKESKDCEFGYRKSFFSGKNYTILYAILRTSPGKNVRESMIDMFRCKTSKQPYNFGSCGSIFKKSVLPAPLFIESAGLKGLRVGDAEVSTKHCGFVVNKKNCTQRQVLKIIYKIKRTVWKKHAILLHNEVIVLGGRNGIFRRLSHTHRL